MVKTRDDVPDLHQRETNPRDKRNVVPERGVYSYTILQSSGLVPEIVRSHVLTLDVLDLRRCCIFQKRESCLPNRDGGSLHGSLRAYALQTLYMRRSSLSF